MSEESSWSFSAYISGPRWAGVVPWLYALSYKLEVKLTIDHQDKGWIRETVAFTINGTEKNVKTFRAAYNATARAYNQ